MTLILSFRSLEQYAISSTFEDPNDQRNAEAKYNWLDMYLAERRARDLQSSDVTEERLARYRETMEITLKRRTQGDRRRDARAAAKVAVGSGGVVYLVSDGSDGSETVDGGRPCSSKREGGAAEGSVRQKRTISAVGAKSKEHRMG